jgi:DNA replication protein DnaC
MRVAQLDGMYHQLIRSLRKTDLLILDDWLCDSLSLIEAQYLLDILDDRYNRRATMLVSQFPISAWYARFPDPTLADAVLDRIVHSAYQLNLLGDSQRKVRGFRSMSHT